MKKYGLIIGLSLCTVLSLTACGKKNEDVSSEATTEMSVPGVNSETDSYSVSDNQVLPDQADVFDTEDDTEVETTEQVTEEITEEDTAVLADEDNISDNSDLQEVPVTGDDTFGSIAGVGFDLKKGPIDFTNTFAKAGFNFTDSEENYAVVKATAFNISNGDSSIIATVQKIDADYDTSGNSINNIINEGITSYEVNVKDAINSSKPYMTFKGCTWGASSDDIIKAYGECLPEDKIDSDFVTKLTYRYEDYTISFTVFKAPSGASGLQSVYVYPSTH